MAQDVGAQGEQQMASVPAIYRKKWTSEYTWWETFIYSLQGKQQQQWTSGWATSPEIRARWIFGAVAPAALRSWGHKPAKECVPKVSTCVSRPPLDASGFLPKSQASIKLRQKNLRRHGRGAREEKILSNATAASMSSSTPLPPPSLSPRTPLFLRASSTPTRRRWSTRTKSPSLRSPRRPPKP
jgi:hypothetical protein